MKQPKQSCKTCFWAQWDLTPTGRIRRDSFGQCTVPLPTVVYPDSVTRAYGYQAVPRRQSVQPTDGSLCPLWAVQQGKLIQIGRITTSPRG